MEFARPDRWNIFARELEDVLANHGLQLSELDDQRIVLHPEKVRRLKRSLSSPTHLTTLNPDEMDRLISKLRLSYVEQKQLHAALLATAVEMILMDRIDNETAYMASNDVFRILFASMKAQPDTAMATSVRGASMLDDQDVYTDTAFSDALDLIDRAVLGIHVSKQANTPKARIAHASEAHAAFAQALTLLEQCQIPHHDSEDWQYWYNETIDGLKLTQTLMQSEGA